MKTEVIMKRSLFNHEIRQRSKSGFFSATDLVNAGNKYRITNDKSLFNLSSFLNKTSSKEFIDTLERDGEKAVIKSRGRNSTTWVHPFVFIDIALAISPELKKQVYSWVTDELLKHRNGSGESYKKMTGALWLTTTNHKSFQSEIVSVANRIKRECNILDWQTADAATLELREKIQNNIALLADVLPNKEALLDIAIKKATDG